MYTRIESTSLLDNRLLEADYVWSELYRTCYENALKSASTEFLDGLVKLNLQPYQTPTVASLNIALRETGWRVLGCDAFLPLKKYYECLGNRVVPVNVNSRSAENIFFSPFPDMFHDVFGHIPLLFNKHYRNFLYQLGQVGSVVPQPAYHKKYYDEVIDSAYGESGAKQRLLDFSNLPIERLNRLTWWATEVGLIKENSKYKIYGAALVSSPAESDIAKLNLKKINKWSQNCVESNYNPTEEQTEFYALNDFSDLDFDVKKLIGV